MLIKIVGNGTEADSLFVTVGEVLGDLGFSELITLEKTDDAAYKMELGITQNPALCIEEESIDFRDTIFEGVVPEKQEITSLLISIIGGGESGDSCGTGGCGTCSSGCH